MCVGLRLRGLLSQWREVPAGKFDNTVGIHARWNRHHTRRGAKGEEGTRNLKTLNASIIYGTPTIYQQFFFFFFEEMRRIFLEIIDINSIWIAQNCVIIYNKNNFDLIPLCVRKKQSVRLTILTRIFLRCIYHQTQSKKLIDENQLIGLKLDWNTAILQLVEFIT